VPVTAVFHGPWTAQGAEVQLQVIQFLKNLSIAGGLLAVAAAGPGLFSLDERRAQGAKAERASWKAVRAS
jgi:putative oxidoreductase